MAQRQFCTFRLGDFLFGVDVRCVQEVLRHEPMTRVPRSSPAVRGLINLRGQIVTAIDLRHRLGLPPDDREPMNVVLHSGDGPLSLLVDSIGEVLEVDDSAFEPPPQTLGGAGDECVLGVYKLEGRLLLILDTDQVACLPVAEPAGGRA